MAENTSDGVTAPMMYIFIGGAPLGYLYKAINTMDSILGYKNERYLNFGRYPAKLDDVANFIPSRLTALLMIAASFLLGFDGRNAVRIFRRDRAKHASPNSAQTESVCARSIGSPLSRRHKILRKGSQERLHRRFYKRNRSRGYNKKPQANVRDGGFNRTDILCSLRTFIF